MPDSTVIRTAETYPVRYVYWPSFSLWSAVFLMNMAGELPGQSAWIEKTQQDLDSDLRARITILNAFNILPNVHREQLRQETMSHEIPNLLHWLSLLEPAEFAQMIPPKEKILPLSNERTRFGMQDPIAQWDGEQLDAHLLDRMRKLHDDPNAFQQFMVQTLERFWDGHLEPEFQRFAPELRAAVERGNLNHRPRTRREIILEMVGREPAGETFDGQGVTEVVAIPVCHVGSFALTRHLMELGSVMLIAFEAARIPTRGIPPDSHTTASTYFALADETRLSILRFLSLGERYGTEIVNHCELSQPTVSKHLRMLVAEGLLTVRREGGTKYYSVNPSRLAQVGRSVEELGKA